MTHLTPRERVTVELLVDVDREIAPLILAFQRIPGVRILESSGRKTDNMDQRPSVVMVHNGVDLARRWQFWGHLGELCQRVPFTRLELPAGIVRVPPEGIERLIGLIATELVPIDAAFR